MVTCCGGTQLCPFTVMVPPACTLLDEISITGGLDANTVNGPSSWLLATPRLVIRILQMLYCSLTCPAEAGHAKARSKVPELLAVAMPTVTPDCLHMRASLLLFPGTTVMRNC